jgi:hypothetical protein
MKRSLQLRAGPLKAADVGKKSFKEKIKEFATSKTNIGATAAGAGYELGKAQKKNVRRSYEENENRRSLKKAWVDYKTKN